MMKVKILLTCICLAAFPTHAMNMYEDVENTNANQEITQLFTQGQLAQILAPIALYPDTLLSHILIAASYPLEVVEAYRWQSKREGMSDYEFSEALEEQDWDASVKALVPFETVLAKMHDDLSWMRDVGDAFLGQEQDVLDTIQLLRQQAYEAGNLDNLAKTKVDFDDKKIIIVSKEPDVIYVPYYDSRVVFGDWRWRHFPPRYWYETHYYQPLAWHAGVHIGVRFFFSAFHWHLGHVVVNHHHSFKHRKRHHIIKSGYTKRWHHKPRHRKNVSYRTTVIKNKYQRASSHTVRYTHQKGNEKLARNTNLSVHNNVVKKISSSTSKRNESKRIERADKKVTHKMPNRHNKKRQLPIEQQYERVHKENIKNKNRYIDKTNKASNKKVNHTKKSHSDKRKHNISAPSAHSHKTKKVRHSNKF